MTSFVSSCIFSPHFLHSMTSYSMRVPHSMTLLYIPSSSNHNSASTTHLYKRKDTPTKGREITEVRGTRFVWGTTNDHDEIGFVPFFHKNIMEMRGIIPITIFNRKWQEEALAWHATYRPKEESSSEKGITVRYQGKPYPEELRQTHSQWTINHACARVTLKQFGYHTLVEWLAIHVENCEKLCQRKWFHDGVTIQRKDKAQHHCFPSRVRRS